MVQVQGRGQLVVGPGSGPPKVLQTWPGPAFSQSMHTARRVMPFSSRCFFFRRTRRVCPSLLRCFPFLNTTRRVHPPRCVICSSTQQGGSALPLRCCFFFSMPKTSHPKRRGVETGKGWPGVQGMPHIFFFQFIFINSSVSRHHTPNTKDGRVRFLLCCCRGAGLVYAI